MDWGLGHTTRCVPLMEHLVQKGHTVVFAGNEWQRSYIAETFPEVEAIHLDGYNVRYSRTGAGFMTRILSQVSGILNTIDVENDWLLNLIKSRHFDAVISDNRYGLYHPQVPSIIMTHQLSVITGLGAMPDAILRKLHYRYLSRFSECWIIDNPGEINLAGKLSHPRTILPGCQYIGLVSQMRPTGNIENDYLLVLLSGPEPQRGILSALLWQQAQDYKGRLVFVEGSEKAKEPRHIPKHISYYKRITGGALQPLLQNAQMVICRSGYSTLMDMVALNKKAILIPTPGQTEQEYLGRHLHKQGIFYNMEQKRFDLQKALTEAEQFPFNSFALADAHDEFKQVMDNWLDKL